MIGKSYISDVIPQHFHFIWEGKRFPFVNRLAVESVFQTHPLAKVTIHYSDPPSNEHWQALQGRAEFKAIDLSELLQDIPWGTEIRRVIEVDLDRNYPAGRSNILRYLILWRWGGIYLDFDTITLKPLDDLLETKGFIGQECIFKCDDDRVKGIFKIEGLWAWPAFGLSYYMSRFNHRHLHLPFWNQIDQFLQKFWAGHKLNNAVLAAEAKAPFFQKALELIPVTDPKIRFNLGPILVNRLWDEFGSLGMSRQSNNAFYAIPPSQTDRFFCSSQTIPQEAYLVHWCSSNERDKAALLEKSYLEQKPTERSLLFHQLAYKVIQKLPQNS